MTAQRPAPAVTRAVVLRTIRHGDRTMVLKAWTSRHGLRAYLVRTGGKQGSSAAALQPLTRVEIVADEHPERDIQTLREMRVSRPYLNLAHDPVRGALALFIQEVLCRTLRVESAEEGLDEFVHEALEAMDTADELRHFPLVFLLRLSGHLGFFPEAPGPGEDRFDLREGHFIAGATPHGHTMAPAISAAMVSMLEVGFHDTPSVTLSPTQRRDLLDHLLLYFRMHVEGMGELRSPAMLHQVLH